MKKFLAACLACCCILSCVSVRVAAASAEETALPVSPDALAEETVAELENAQSFRLERRPLYGLNLAETGYLYDTEADGRKGFMIVLGEGDGYEVAEYYGEAENPYRGAEFPVYGGFLTYLEVIGRYLCDALTGERVARLYGDFNTSLGSETQRVEYSRKSESAYRIGRGLPSYLQSSYPNACANIAGGIVVGYYDSFYDELIPGYAAYSGGRWTPENSAARNVVDALYFDMKTNVYGGTTYENFRAGLSAYARRRGRSVSFSNLARGGTLGFSSFDTAVRNGRPVVLFVDKYNALSAIAQMNGCDMMVTNYYSGNHTMVAYGYRNVAYYRNETRSVWSPVWYNPFRFVKVTEEKHFRTDNYINVRTVIPSLPDGYIRLYDSCTLDYAVSVDIW